MWIVEEKEIFNEMSKIIAAELWAVKIIWSNEMRLFNTSKKRIGKKFNESSLATEIENNKKALDNLATKRMNLKNEKWNENEQWQNNEINEWKQ